jgi:hypothetical protein
MDFFDLFKKDLSDLWKEHKLFLIFFGIFILIFEFRNILLDLLISGAREEVKATQKEDAKLASQQNAANDKANALVAESNSVGKDDKPVDENWYKKDEE